MIDEIKYFFADPKGYLKALLLGNNQIGREYPIEYWHSTLTLRELFWRVMSWGIVPVLLALTISLKYKVVGFFMVTAILLVVIFTVLVNFRNKLFGSRIFHVFFKNKRDYKEILEIFQERNKDEIMKIVDGEIYDLDRMTYIEKENQLEVIAHLEGGNNDDFFLSGKAEQRLTVALNMELDEIKHSEGSREFKYIYNKYPEDNKLIQRVEVGKLGNSNIDNYKDISLNLGDNYSSLIAGVSGSGKSYFLNYLLTKLESLRFIDVSVKGTPFDVPPTLYVIDPKMSDLYDLMRFSGYDKKYYGESKKEAFGIVREVVSIMGQRKQEHLQMSTGSEKERGKTMLEFGFPPVVLVIDEYPSLVAMMDSKERKDFDSMIGNIARLSRQLSVGLWLLCQQPNSQSMSTSVREQLINKFSLGKLTSENAQMTFGKSASEIPDVPDKRGAGLISIGGGDVRSFLAPTFAKDFKITSVLKKSAELISARDSALNEQDLL